MRGGWGGGTVEKSKKGHQALGDHGADGLEALDQSGGLASETAVIGSLRYFD